MIGTRTLIARSKEAGIELIACSKSGKPTGMTICHDDLTGIMWPDARGRVLTDSEWTADWRRYQVPETHNA